MILKGKFSSPGDVGPHFVADFELLEDPEARAMRQQDAYQRVAYLLEKLGIA